MPHAAPAGHGLGLIGSVWVVAALLCGCLAPAPTTDPAEQRGQGVLRVGTSGDYLPFSLDGRGFDVDVAERFAASLGARIAWVPFRWSELADDLAHDRFDVAMSGVTWRPDRAVHGWMSRAVASGGPCVVGAREPSRVAVNRGGFLEGWARRQLAGAVLVLTDDNLSLPGRLERGEVDAFVTDSFELPHFARPDWPVECSPPRHRKVYWVAPARASELGPVLDAWLRSNETLLGDLRERWFGRSASRDDADHVIDLLARRLALMPHVARWKGARGQPIEDREREAVVLAATRRAAARAGVDVRSADRLFRLQIELAKRVQTGAMGPVGDQAEPELDLVRELRPLLLRLGSRIVDGLARAAPIPEGRLRASELSPFSPLLQAEEIESLRTALADVRPAEPAVLLETRVHTGEPANRGREHYSAWFASERDGVLFFGLSPFWELWWPSGGDALADLREPGDHLVGRFDLERERFMPPLRLRSGARGSVWDVLAHSNRSLYYTAYFEGAGRVAPDGTAAAIFSSAGTGLNELVEGPDGNLYVTRYSDAPDDPQAQRFGSVVVLSPEGVVLREIPLGENEPGFTAPKSIAVDPESRDVWLNTDTFLADGTIAHETILVAAGQGEPIRTSGPPELHFVHFDRTGRGWFAEVAAGRLRLRVTRGGTTLHALALGSIGPLDFVQEIVSAADGGVILTLWSGDVFWVAPSSSEEANGFACRRMRFELPTDCVPPARRSLLYTAVLHGERLFATLYCGATVLAADVAALDPESEHCQEAPSGGRIWVEDRTW